MKIKYFKKLSENAKIKIVIKVNDYSLDDVRKILTLIKEDFEDAKITKSEGNK